MTPEAFRRSAEHDATPPDELGPILEALWWDIRGDWNRAHARVADRAEREAAWVHAYLHRREGDTGNAAYWYRRAGRPVSAAPLDVERDAIATALLASA